MGADLGGGGERTTHALSLRADLGGETSPVKPRQLKPHPLTPSPQWREGIPNADLAGAAGCAPTAA